MADIFQQWRSVLGLVDSSPLSICLAFERLAVRLAPIDLGSVPLYVRPASSLSIWLQAVGRATSGWYHYYAARWMRDSFGDAWRGFGPAIAWHDIPATAELAAYVAGHPDAATDAAGVQSVCDDVLVRGAGEVLLHELGHALEDIAAGMFTSEPAATDRELAEGLLCLVATRGVDRPAPPPRNIDDHGLAFTRVMVHLVRRLRALGVGIDDASVLAAGAWYSMSSFASYQAAFADEAERHASDSFRSIMALPMPSDASALYSADCSRREVGAKS